MERVLRLVLGPAVQGGDGAARVPVVHHHGHVRADHVPGAVRGQQEGARVVDVLHHMRVPAGPHRAGHTHQAVQPRHAAHGRGRVPRLRGSHAGRAPAQAVRDTLVVRPVHQEHNRLVPRARRLRDPGHGHGAAGGRRFHRGQAGLADHADGGHVVSNGHVRGCIRGHPPSPTSFTRFLLIVIY